MGTKICFRNFIYLDEEKLYGYWGLLDDKCNSIAKTTTENRFGGIGAFFNRIAGIKLGTEKSTISEIRHDINIDYNNFEAILAKRGKDVFFDLTTNKSRKLSEIPQMGIMRLHNTIEIPDGFDVYTLFDKVMPDLIQNSQTEQPLLKNILPDTSTKIPILMYNVDDSGIVVFAKLNSRSLKVNYTELEDFSEQEAYILCRTSNISRKIPNIVFEPLRDAMNIPRSMRRGIKIPDTLYRIEVHAPVLNVDVIAIYT